MKPGTYRLREDFYTPHPDRRVKQDWRKQPVIKKGTLFQVQDGSALGIDTAPDYLVAWAGPWSSMRVSNRSSSEWLPLFGLLDPVPDTPKLWLRREHSLLYAVDLLDHFVATGRLTMEDLHKASEEMRLGDTASPSFDGPEMMPVEEADEPIRTPNQ